MRVRVSVNFSRNHSLSLSTIFPCLFDSPSPEMKEYSQYNVGVVMQFAGIRHRPSQTSIIHGFFVGRNCTQITKTTK